LFIKTVVLPHKGKIKGFQRPQFFFPAFKSIKLFQFFLIFLQNLNFPGLKIKFPDFSLALKKFVSDHQISVNLKIPSQVVQTFKIKFLPQKVIKYVNDSANLEDN